MLLESLKYVPYKGWSNPLPEALDSPDTLLLLFANPTLLRNNSPCLNDIRAAFPQATLVGCSTATPFVNGQIAVGEAALVVCQFQKSHLETTLLPIESPIESHHVGRTLGKLLYRPNLRSLLLFADERVLNVNEFMQGVNSIAPSPILIGGGMAGHPDFINGDRILILGDQIQTHAVVAVGLYSDDDALIVEQVVGVGMENHSLFYEVTAAEGRVLYTLNDRPALDVYCEFLGEMAPYLSDITHIFPVGFFASPVSPLRVIRSVFQIDKDTKSLIFFGDLPQERYIRFMLGLPTGFITSAEVTSTKVSQMVQQRGANQPLLALTISCICRQFALGKKVGQEPAAAFAAMPVGTTQIGFYGSGEIAWSGSGYCELHNHTINITLLGER